MDDTRRERISHRIIRELSELLFRGEIKDPRVNNFISFSFCKLAKDGSTARIGVSTFMDAGMLDKAVEGLNSASGFLQNRISKSIRLRQTPHIYFVADHSIEQGQEVIRKIEELDETTNG